MRNELTNSQKEKLQSLGIIQNTVLGLLEFLPKNGLIIQYKCNMCSVGYKSDSEWVVFNCCCELIDSLYYTVLWYKNNV